MKSGKHISAFVLNALVTLALVAPASLAGANGATYTLADHNPLENGWTDTGLALPNLSSSTFCVDDSEPNILLVTEPGTGTVSYNWSTRARQVINAKPFELCGPGGLMFASMVSPTGADGSAPIVSPVLRFSRKDPAGKSISYMPVHVARDGTLQVYAFGYLPGNKQSKKLMSSSDGGLTWQERGQQFNGEIEEVVMSYPDSQSLYALVQAQKLTPPDDTAYAIYYSQDGGTTWELRSKLNTTLVEGGGRQVVELSVFESMAAPVDSLMVTLTDYHQASNASARQRVFLSADGARTMTLAVERDLNKAFGLLFAHTHEGILRWQIKQVLNNGRANYEKTLELSTDGGYNWRQLPVPIKQGEPLNWSLAAVPDAPASIFLWGPADDGTFSLYYSADGGHTWRLEEPNSVGLPILTPYLPLQMLQIVSSHLYVRDAPEIGRTLAKETVPNKRKDSARFLETGHNLSGTFKEYWDEHGGLAQQGYPLTEPFHEVSDTDGLVYLVQYFERAVFELHPANAPPNRVQLSLLGDFLYAHNYPEGAPAQAVTTSPDAKVFRETGKHVGGVFLDYWNEHGGVAQQGLPITEEFEERNALDHRPYTVQYFERAVFEYHPENPPPYNVLLSQLGTYRYQSKYGGPTTMGEGFISTEQMAVP